MTDKPVIDWERIELDYRAGILTLREIADQNSITHGAINKRANRDGWVRDLSAKIKAKADELVSKALVSSEVSREKAGYEKAVIDAGAAAIVEIKLKHRKGISKQRDLSDKLMLELETCADDLAPRIDMAKKLAETFKVLVGMERQAFSMDDAAEERLDENLAALIARGRANAARD